MATHFEKLKKALKGRYELERTLGEGGMATVYLANDVRHRRGVAVKVLRPELAVTLGVERFNVEIEIAAGLTHAHIVPVFDSGQADGFLYYVQPFIEGESLAERIDRDGQQPIADVTRVLGDIAGALAKAHSRGVVHRDVKPDNVMISDGHALVTDFGVAKALTEAADHKLTTAGTAIGTPAYMAPEQAAADPAADHRADIYALGAVGYEMLTGKPPFRGTNLQQIIAAQIKETPTPLHDLRPDVPPLLASTVMRCLEKNPDDRWQSAEELGSILANQRGTPLPTKTSAKPNDKRRGMLVGIIAAAALAVGGVSFLVANRDRGGSLNPDVIAVAPFDMLGVDNEFWGEGFAELLSHNLDGAGRLRTVSPTVSFARWVGRADPASAEAFGQQFDAGLALFGRIIAEGTDSVRVSATLLDVSDQDILRSVEVRGGTTELPDIADRVAATLLTDLSQIRSLGAAQLNSLGSQSSSAIREFLLGERHYRSFRMDSAELHYQRALDIDSVFALALGRLGMIAAWEGTASGDADRYRLAAGALNHGLSSRESLLVVADSLAASLSRGSAPNAETTRRMRRYFETLQSAIELYPGDAQIVYRMGEGLMHRGWAWGATELATLNAFDEAVRLDSAFALAYPHLFYLRYSFDGIEAGNEATCRYLALRPSGAPAVGARATLEIVEQLTSGNRTFLDTASAVQLLGPVAMIGRSVDSLEIGTQAARALVRKDPSLQDVAAFTIVYRGHLQEAEDILTSPATSQSWMAIAEADYLQGSSELLGERTNAPPVSSVHPMLALRHWADNRDTTAILAFIQRQETNTIDSRRRGPDWVAFPVERARAFLELARGDSTLALSRFDGLSSYTCSVGCYWIQLTHALLLRQAGRNEEIVRMLTPFPQLLFGVSLPGEIIWVLERARAREHIGDVQGARSDFLRVANAWANGDEAVQPAVTEARRALERLVDDTGS